MESSKKLTMYHYTQSPKRYSAKMIDRYLERGWFRMKQKIFTTTHNLYEETTESLHRVWWLRYNVNEYLVRESHKRLLKRSSNFSVSIDRFSDDSTEEHELYDLYRSNIDFEGYVSLNDFLYGRRKIKSKYNTYAIRIRDGNKLIAVGLFDKGLTAAASGLHFYHPDYSKYSLGKLMMLLTIDFMKTHKMQWYYPGYVVVGKPKLDYKLFLGKNIAQYFDYESSCWHPFSDEIMNSEEYTSDDMFRFRLYLMFTDSPNADIEEIISDLNSIEAPF